LKIDVQPSQNSVSIGRFSRCRAWGIMERVCHPCAAARELQNITSSNGAIRVETIEGRTHLKTSNGGIRAFGLQGTLDARTSNGSIDLSDVSGDTTLHTSNGGIKADVKKGTSRRARRTGRSRRI